MKRVCFCIFSILFLLGGGSFQSWAASHDDLARQCPQADKYRLQRSFYFSNLKEVVRAPQSPEEVKARFAELSSSEKWRRQAAISSLALAGNIDLFKQLQAEGDSDGMTTYASNYLRKDGNLCLDPTIEKTITSHFHDPRFSRPFLSFFHKNLYTSRAFFETLTPLQFDPDDPDQYGRLVKALCATRLTGLDKPLLEIGRASLPHDTPVQKRVMPGVHQSLIRYFASQQAPVFSYFRAVLAAEPRSEAVVYFQNSYTQTRIALYQALAEYDDDDSFAIFLEQLAELSREPWGPFFVNDLHQLLSHLKDHRLFTEKEDKMISLVAQILATPSLSGQPGFVPPRERAGEAEVYDQQVREEVYALLAKIDSEAAWALMLDELTSLLLRPMNNWNKILIDTLLQRLASFSDTTPIDVECLVGIVGEVQDQVAIVRVAEILSRHPHPVGFRFVLSQFAKSYAERDEKKIWVDSQIAARLFDILLKFSAPEYLGQTREKIDTLFMEEKLHEDRFRSMSRAVAELLGEDSTIYLALLQNKKEEREKKRQQELAAAQARWRQEMVAELALQSSEEGISINIEALSKFGPAAKKAGYWLIRIGKPVLPQVHVALADPAATSELKMQLMVVLGEIGEQSSTVPIIAAAKTEPANTMLLKDAFLSLARIPQTEESIAFAKEWLEDAASSSRQKMSALAYFASHRDKQALSWSRKFSSPETETSLRAVALYLAAMVGEKESKGQIVEMLANHQDRATDYVLWRGLAEITSYKEFKHIMNKLQSKETWELKQVNQYVRFRTSKGQEKIELADKLITAKTPVYSETAIRFLLERKAFDTLAKYFEKKGPYAISLEMGLYLSPVEQRIFSEARRQGYRLEEKEGKIQFFSGN